MGERMKRYAIRVRGFDTEFVEATSAGKARYKTYRSWRDAGYGRRRYPEFGTVTFGEFLAEQVESFLHMGRPLSSTPPEAG